MLPARWRSGRLRRTIAGVELPSDSLHFAFGPLLALLLVLFLGGLLRWTFGTGRDLVVPQRGEDYGLLTEVTVVPTGEAAEVLRQRLADEGLRATVAPTDDGSGRRILVFPDDVPAAKVVLARRE